MNLVLKLNGSPIAQPTTLVEGYMLMRDEFAKRWPSDFYGPQEAAAHGLTLEGQQDVTPEEARELRKALRDERKAIGPGIRERLAHALRRGRLA